MKPSDQELAISLQLLISLSECNSALLVNLDDFHQHLHSPRAQNVNTCIGFSVPPETGSVYAGVWLNISNMNNHEVGIQPVPRFWKNWYVMQSQSINLIKLPC